MSEKKLTKAERTGLVGQLDAPYYPEAAPGARWVKDGLKHGWYLPETNAYPREQSAFDGDLGQLIREAVLPGHTPATPPLDEHQSIITLGSCFARELREVLNASGIPATRFWIPSGLNNTFAILDFLSWCVTGAQTGHGFRYERGAGGDIREWTPEAEREAYAESLARAGAFVFTIGLAEVWQDRETGGVFWRGVPADVFNADRHVFRLTTVDENTRNLREIVALVRQVNTHAPIVLTLSPVPLLATHRHISCLTADCVSKSVLRVALDQAMADGTAGLYYWPSFEIVKWVGANLPRSAYGDKGHSRDVDRGLVTAIIDAFIDAFYTPSAVAAIRDRRAS
jgi:hypothetical protein